MSPHSNADTSAPLATGTRTEEGTHLMHRSLKVEPAMVESANGLQLHLANGRTVLDACGGAAVAIIGHGNDEVAKAMLRQASKVSYVHTQSYTTPAAEDLANFLLQGSPHGLEKAFFVCSGSEAVESALKLARQYFFEKGETHRVHFVSRQQSYHGNTMGSLSVSSNLARKVPYQVGPSKVIAFLAESVGGATAGCVPPPPGYLRGARALCDKYGILLILDEIMCGTGRCGTYFAFEPEDVVPDLVTVAKGLGGGYCSIAAVLAHKNVVDVIRRGTSSFNHGHTYQAHPVACATALAVQRIVRRDDLVARCAAMGKLLEAKLRAELSGCPSVGDVRGRGLFWAVEFVKNRETKETFDPLISFGIKVQQTAFEAGVAVYPGWLTVDGTKGDHVLLAPPFTVAEEELDIIVRVLKSAITVQEQVYM
ncbi:hypothetical protein NHJ13734_003568 [Beauveria thailandica]